MDDIEKHLQEILRLKKLEELKQIGEHMPSLEIVKAMKSEAEAEVAKYDGLTLEIEKDLKASEDKGFDLGLAQAGVPATDKIYSEADLAAEIAKAKELMAAEMSLGQAAVVAEAVDKITAEIIAGVEDSNVDNVALVAKYKKA